MYRLNRYIPRRRSYMWMGFVFSLALFVSGCDSAAEREETALFERLSSQQTGITFVNELPENAEINILNYLYYYNGGGVAVGDINNNGLQDIYLTSNLGPNRLYLNKGDFKFEDITTEAGVAGTDGWTSGVTMADVTGNGYVDIYVSGVNHLDLEGRNILYVNNGDGTFTDRTTEFGLEHEGYSTQAAFFDFNGNGYLDMYLMNHAVHTERSFRDISQRHDRDPKAGDRLFLNKGGHFVDISDNLGIYGGSAGYGLGIAVSDFNRNGCLDIYIGNDFHENDFLYRNNCDGTLTESIAEAMGHTSYFSMGVDAADITNNGLVDLAVLDMQPEQEDILKTSVMAEGYDTYRYKLSLGYHPQYARNTLQLNRGQGRFSEIGYLAGVHATDWSWSALFADLDNSGWKDLFVSNGIYRRPNDLDYINYISNQAIQASLERGITEENLDLLEQMPQIAIPNYAYRNNGDLTFTNMAAEWGLEDHGFSNGTAYVDLNNDGTLDLVVNNINEEAGIYRNRGREINGNRYLKVKLDGQAPNTLGIGAKVELYYDDIRQLQEQMPTRGFQSSVDHRLNFGLGSTARVDSVRVIWPDRRTQVLTDVAPDQMLTFRHDEATDIYQYDVPMPADPLFRDVTADRAPKFRHDENTFIDFNREPFLTHKLSREGPALAVGDVTGNGLDDFFVGGAKWQAGMLYLQQQDGSFTSASTVTFEEDGLHEDVDAAFFDANGNGHLDLYVVSGGNEFWGDHDALQDRLYLNDGAGGFVRAHDSLPHVFANGSVVVPGDFTGDGATDLFVGSRSVARSYGTSPRSVLLRNDGTGIFSDVTDQIAPQQGRAGMVTDAVWTDYTRNGRLDLVLVGEWMPVILWEQQGDGRFVDRTGEAGFSESEGWWSAVAAADLTGDGYEDLVLGNLGLNSYVRATPEQPARLFMNDFDATGRVEQILTFYKADGVSYPIYGRNTFVDNLPSLRRQYPTYTDFADRRIDQIISAGDLRSADVLEANFLSSVIALNQGDGSFVLEQLPVEAQFAPVHSIVVGDLLGDGEPEIILAGNFHDVVPLRGRYDASYGLVLSRNGEGRFSALSLEQSNLVLEGQIRDLQWIRTADDPVLVAARNNDGLQMVQWRQPQFEVENTLHASVE